jgi:hypothetical protein
VSRGLNYRNKKRKRIGRKLRPQNPKTGRGYSASRGFKFRVPRRKAPARKPKTKTDAPVFPVVWSKPPQIRIP